VRIASAGAKKTVIKPSNCEEWTRRKLQYPQCTLK